jgi:hypothetical protein
MMHRGLATLSGALMLCFLLLTGFEPQFFALHFYQSLIYLLIILMLFYFEDHWAYALGIMTPAVWLVLHVGTGLLASTFLQIPAEFSRIFSGVTPSNGVAVITVLIALLSAAMIFFNWARWKREFMGAKKESPVFLGSFIVVAIYYGVLVYWFWHLYPTTSGS